MENVVFRLLSSPMEMSARKGGRLQVWLLPCNPAAASWANSSGTRGFGLHEPAGSHVTTLT